MTTARTSPRPGPLSRLGGWLDRTTPSLLIANVVAQAALIATGGLVRLTKSGLGCSKAWYCEEGSLVPTNVEPGEIHPYIEFGNRVVVVFLALIAGTLAIAVWRTRPRLRALGLVPFAGVVAQAVLGASLVNHELPPLLVGIHMVISVTLVWASMQLLLRWRGAPPLASGPGLGLLRWASLALFAALIVLGTFTTGTGPHSGDDAAVRLDFDPATVTRLHSLSVWAFTAVVAAIGWIVAHHLPSATLAAASPTPRGARLALAYLLGAIIVQGAIGYIQYATDRPVGWVFLHLVGIGALTAAHSATFHLTRRA